MKLEIRVTAHPARLKVLIGIFVSPFLVDRSNALLSDLVRGLVSQMAPLSG